MRDSRMQPTEPAWAAEGAPRWPRRPDTRGPRDELPEGVTHKQRRVEKIRAAKPAGEAAAAVRARKEPAPPQLALDAAARQRIRPGRPMTVRRAIAPIPTAG